MSGFVIELDRRLAEIREQGLYRELRRVDSAQSPRLTLDGRTLLNFSSNDYLGLANHPALREAAIRAVERFGAGSGSARLVCGSLAPHHELEEALAAFKQTEAALSFSSGYNTSVGAISAVAGREDVVVLDKLVHASIVDGARLSGAKLRVFAHNDLDELADILRWADQRGPSAGARRPRTLIVTESVFSMDGDRAPLREMVALKEKHGAWLMVDEAHATGFFGANRRGLAEELGVSGQIEIQMGTLGKAFGSAGGYICGARALKDYLVNRARSFIFSTAPVPAAAAAARAGVELAQSPEGKARAENLWALVRELKSGLAGRGWEFPGDGSAIVPLIIGEEGAAMAAAAALREAGVFVPAVRYPTVARGTARLRVTMTAGHAAADVAELIAGLAKLPAKKLDVA
jgi:8-amino-7-oxononanoate synthase